MLSKADYSPPRGWASSNHWKALRGNKNEVPPVRLVGQKHLHYGRQCTRFEIGVIWVSVQVRPIAWMLFHVGASLPHWSKRVTVSVYITAPRLSSAAERKLRKGRGWVFLIHSCVPSICYNAWHIIGSGQMSDGSMNGVTCGIVVSNEIGTWLGVRGTWQAHSTWKLLLGRWSWLLLWLERGFGG